MVSMYNTCMATFNLFGLDGDLNALNEHCTVKMQQHHYAKWKAGRFYFTILKPASKNHQLKSTIQQQRRYIFRKKLLQLT